MRKNKADKCLSGICVATVKANIELLNKDRNDVVSPKCMVLVAVGERHKGLQKRLSRNDVTECLSRIICRCRHSKSKRRHKSVPVSGRITTSNLCSTGNPWSKRIDLRVHKLDGFPLGVMVLLL